MSDKQQSIISRIHTKVSLAEKRYTAIEDKCNRILELQERSHLSPLWIVLMVIGAFIVGGWIIS